MSTTERTNRDFAGVNDRFRPRPEGVGGRAGAYTFKPDSVRSTEKVLNHRLQSRLRSSLPNFATFLFGAVLALLGVYNSLDILSLRGSQTSLVNNLLLVFSGAFLVFLSLHERHVERAHRGTP